MQANNLALIKQRLFRQGRTVCSMSMAIDSRSNAFLSNYKYSTVSPIILPLWSIQIDAFEQTWQVASICQCLFGFSRSSPLPHLKQTHIHSQAHEQVAEAPIRLSVRQRLIECL